MTDISPLIYCIYTRALTICIYLHVLKNNNLCYEERTSTHFCNYLRYNWTNSAGKEKTTLPVVRLSSAVGKEGSQEIHTS